MEIYGDIQRLLMDDLIAIPILFSKFFGVRAPFVDLGYGSANLFSLTYFYHITEKTRLLKKKK